MKWIKLSLSFILSVFLINSIFAYGGFGHHNTYYGGNYQSGTSYYSYNNPGYYYNLNTYTTTTSDTTYPSTTYYSTYSYTSQYQSYGYGYNGYGSRGQNIYSSNFVDNDGDGICDTYESYYTYN
jgi:hypothetical protein